LKRGSVVSENAEETVIGGFRERRRSADQWFPRTPKKRGSVVSENAEEARIGDFRER